MSSDVTAGLVPDIYGQVHPEETLDLVNNRIAAFDKAVKAVTKVESEQNKCLLQATSKCPELLSEKFKLLFLRCEVFNVDLAVKRYLKYWKTRVEVYGNEKAFRKLTVSDSLSEDNGTLSTGYICLVEGASDEKGRSILLADPSTQDRSKYSRESMRRVFWYTMHCALESENAQRHGVVILVHPEHAKFGQFDRKLQKTLIGSLQATLPVRVAAFHICRPPVFASILLPIVKLLMSERLRKRINLHSGDNAHILDTLAKYGISKENTPTRFGGNKEVNVVDFFKRREASGK